MRKILAGLTLVLALGVSGPAIAAETAVAVPGTRITLVPPPGFELATKFVGLSSIEPGASFNVSESLPRAFERVRQSVTRANELQQRGLRLVEVDMLPGFPYEHVVAYATRMQEGFTIDVWILVFKHEDITGTVVASLARSQSPPVSVSAMRAALATARVVPVPPGGMVSQLPFTVDIPARFAYRKALAGRQLIVKETPPPPQGAASDVTASIVLTTRDPVEPPVRETFARQQVFALTAVQVDSVDDPVPVTIGGLPGFEFLGQGRNTAGQPRRIYAVVIFTRKEAFTIVALGPPDLFQAALGDVRALARSFKAK